MVDANQAQSSGTWQPGVQWDFHRALATARALDALELLLAGGTAAPLRLSTSWPASARRWPCPLPAARTTALPPRVPPDAGAECLRLAAARGMVLNGITTLRARWARWPEAYGKLVSLHHGGRILGTIAHLHLVASWPNAPYLGGAPRSAVADYRHAETLHRAAGGGCCRVCG